MRRIKSTVLLVIGVLIVTFAYPMSINAEDLLAKDAKMVDKYTIRGPVNYYNGIEAIDGDGNVNVVIEIPTGTTGKWEVNKDDGLIKWEFKKGKPRTVDYKGGYPANYGSIPKTKLPKEFGGDGDPLDIVVAGEALPRGAVVKVKILGSVKLVEEGEHDDKLLAVALDSPHHAVKNINELNQKFGGLADKIGEWFGNYKGKNSGIEFKGFGSVEEARSLLNDAIEAAKNF
jgi:inorganic pyrophosphatase